MVQKEDNIPETNFSFNDYSHTSGSTITAGTNLVLGELQRSLKVTDFFFPILALPIVTSHLES